MNLTECLRQRGLSCFALSLGAVLLVLAIGAPASRSAGKGSVAPRKVSLLYVLSAKGATLLPERGSARRYRLAVRRPERTVTWFSDRPARASGAFPTAAFAAEWRGFGFAADPPNAAVDYLDPRGNQRTVLLTLRDPRLRKGRIVFAARLLAPVSAKGPNLSSHAAAADATPPRRLRNAALFVDDEVAPVIDGCVIQPYTSCPRVEFGSEYLPGLQLTGANLPEAGMSGAEVNGGDFSGANLAGSQLLGQFDGTDLSGANLSASWFGGDTFTDVDLSGANLTNATFLQAQFDNSNLRGANASGTSFAEARFCNTVMPNGTINDSGC